MTKIGSRYHRHRLLALDRKHQVIGIGRSPTPPPAPAPLLSQLGGFYSLEVYRTSRSFMADKSSQEQRT